MKIKLSWQIFKKIIKYESSWKSVQWEPCSMRTDRHPYRHFEAYICFRDFAKAPKICANWMLIKLLVCRTDFRNGCTTYIHTCIYTHIRTHTYIYTYILAYTHTYAHIHIYIHTYIHTCTYIHKHTYTNTQLLCVHIEATHRDNRQ
jgi:hypothetical protein